MNVTGPVESVPHAPDIVASATRGAGVGWGWAGAAPALAVSIAGFFVPVVPFVDAPVHLALATIRADFHRQGSAFPRYYALLPNAGPNSLFHLLASASGRPIWALPALLAVALLGTFGMILLLSRRYQASVVFVLVAGLFAVNFSLAYGFIEFSIGVPILLLSVWHLSIADRFRLARQRGGRVAWTIVLALLLCTLFYAHVLLWVFGLLLVGVDAAIALRRDRAHAVAAMLACLPASVWGLTWKLSRTTDTGNAGWLRSFYVRRFIPQYPARVRALLTIDHEKLVGPGVGGWIAAAVVVLAIVAIAACTLSARRRRAASHDGTVRSDHMTQAPVDAAGRRAMYALAIASLGVVGFAPPGLPPLYFFYQRFIFLMFIALALWAGTRAGREYAPRWLVSLLVLANLLLGALWSEHVLSFRAIAGDLVEAVRVARPSGVGAFLIADARYRNDPEALMQAGGLATAIAGVPVQAQWYDLTWPHVTRGPGLTDTIPHDTASFDGIAAFAPYSRAFDWALVHASVPEADREALAQRSASSVHRGQWTVYKFATH